MRFTLKNVTIQSILKASNPEDRKVIDKFTGDRSNDYPVMLRCEIGRAELSEALNIMSLIDPTMSKSDRVGIAVQVSKGIYAVTPEVANALKTNDKATKASITFVVSETGEIIGDKTAANPRKAGYLWNPTTNEYDKLNNYSYQLGSLVTGLGITVNSNAEPAAKNIMDYVLTN